jgi:hypothetical protein
MWKWFCIPAVLLGTAVAADRADLSGAWQLDAAHSQDGKLKAGTLSITQKEGSIQITQALTDPDGRQTKAEIACNTMGKQCKVSDAQMSLYYNGPRLIIIETRHGGDNVVKKRLEPSDDGKSLTLEVLHIAPTAAAEHYTFTRQPATTASQ